MVNRLRFAQAFFRSVFFLPTACCYVVAALIWKMSIFNGVRFGLANTVLGWFGGDQIAWLSTTDPPWYWAGHRHRTALAPGRLLHGAVPRGAPAHPPHLYEAAAVDGARPGWQTFRHITFPQLRATSVAVVLLLVINAFQAFDEFYNLLSDARGYPPYARPPLVYLYYTALGQGQNLGLGSAGAVLLALIIAVVTVGQAKLVRPRPEGGAVNGTTPWVTRPGRALRLVLLIALALAVPDPLLPPGAQRAGHRERHHLARVDVLPVHAALGERRASSSATRPSPTPAPCSTPRSSRSRRRSAPCCSPRSPATAWPASRTGTRTRSSTRSSAP